MTLTDTLAGAIDGVKAVYAVRDGAFAGGKGACYAGINTA